jgi:DNA-binding GntR family transcriptional regulator
VIIPLKDQITAQLRGRILAGEWTEGTRLKEEDLARQFGVSRGPIRDVVLELSKEGLLKALPNRGASVGRLPDPDARAIFLRTRRELESLALTKGFKSWPKGAMANVERILRNFRVAAEAGDLGEVIQHDIAFQGELSVVWLPLMTTMALPYSRHADLMESYGEHVRIFEAIKDADLKLAAKLLKAHIQ